MRLHRSKVFVLSRTRRLKLRLLLKPSDLPPKMFIARLMLSYQLSPNVPGLGQELMGNVKVRPNYYRPATLKILNMSVNLCINTE